MNIAHLISKKFEHTSSSHHRMLTSTPSEGVLAAGYVKKNKMAGSHYNFMTGEYHGILVLSGEGIYQDENHKIKIESGDFIQRLPGVSHSTIITNDYWSELYVVIGKSIYQSLKGLNILQRDPVLHPGIDYETIQLGLHFYDQLGFVDRTELPLLLPQVINYITRIHYLDRTKQPTSQEKDILSLATTYIHEHISERITSDEIADYLNLGYEKFRKLFTKHYGISPGNYIIHQRIRRAQQLLSNPKLSIKEVAISLGYMDAYTFSKQFKKITGHSPSDFQHMFY